MAVYHKNYISEYRKIRGLTQQQLGELVGVETSQISKYESGESMPPWDKIVKMVNVLHVDSEELWGGEKLNKEGNSTLDISKGQVVRREMFSSADEVNVTISLDGIQFSTACVRKWEDVEYIDLIVLEDKEILVIRKSSEDAIDSKKWSKIKEGKMYSRKITGRGFPSQIYKMMKWSKGYRFKIKGCCTLNASDKSEQLWFFRFKDAIGIPMSSGAREKVGVLDKDLESDVLTVLNEIEMQKKIDSAEREEMKKAGKNPGPVKIYICEPDEWGQYSFGLPCEIHDIKPELVFEPRGEVP